MATNLIAQPADLRGLSLEQIAALDTTHEVLAQILPDGSVQVPDRWTVQAPKPKRGFQSSI